MTGATVVALGGNALTRPGERGTAAQQRANLREACEALRPLLAAGDVVVTHGNGPQVGNELLRHERAADEAPPLPLWLAVAQTQGEIGALLASELGPAAGRPVDCLLTHVVVSPDDPAFACPTKPVGPFYSAEQAATLARERGWQLVADAGRGHRRVVPSPQPLAVVETAAVQALLAAGHVPVACGGGGIPVLEAGGRLLGVDAVVDKDRASAVLALALAAAQLVVLTEAPALYRSFGTAEQEEVRALTVAEADALAPSLPAGSMRPKLESCAAFVHATRGTALITSPAALADALRGRAGTTLTA